MRRPLALVVTPQMPWPLDTGGRIGLWQMTTSLTREYRVLLVTLVHSGCAREAPGALTAMGIEVVAVPHSFPPRPIAAIRGVFGRWPYTLARYRNTLLGMTIARLVAERQPAFALVNHLHLAPCVASLGEVPMVLREHNVEYRWLARYAESQRHMLVRAYARQQSERMRRVEAELCRRAAMVLAIHEDEAAALRAITAEARIEVVPVGVDFSRYTPRAPENPPVVLLVGSFDWQPNADGARRFLLEGWPSLRKHAPHVRLRIVGRQLPESLASLARQVGAEPVGYVESMAPEFARASALVVPLWVGAGARVKIVEALAARLPVVSTPLGAEGLGLVTGEHYLGASDPAGLAESLATLIAEPALGERLERAGHALARAQFSLDAVARRTCELCAQVARQSDELQRLASGGRSRPNFAEGSGK